jgi:hypothetical protein
MNSPFRLQGFNDETAKPENTSSLLRGLFHTLIAIFSSPKGDQGGWEGGARGL